MRGIGNEALLRLQIFFLRRAIMSLKATISGRNSSGTPAVEMGARSVGRRRRITPCKRFNGEMPRDSPTQTRMTASG